MHPDVKATVGQVGGSSSMKLLVLECIIPGQRYRILCDGTARGASRWTPAQEGSQLGSQLLRTSSTGRKKERERGGGGREVG